MDGSQVIDAGVVTRRRGHGWRFVLATSVGLAAASAIAFWHVVQPQYRAITTEGVGTERVAMVVTYPSDWYVADGSDASGMWRMETPRVSARIALARRPPRGPQEWIEHYVYRLNEQEWSNLSILLQRVGAVRDLNTEAQRLEAGGRQLAGPRGSVRVRAASCPVGPMLDIEVQNPMVNVAPFWNALVVDQTPPPGAVQYEIMVRYQTTGRLKSRMRQVALDVVSRLKLVKGQ